MFSSFGFDPKGAGRNNHSGTRFFPTLNAPRGFSIHVFKNPTLPTQAPVIPPVASRQSNGGGQWNRQPSYHSDGERKQLAVVPPSQDRRVVQVGAAVNQAWPVERKYSHSNLHSTGKSGKPYGIYPSLTSDIYIYERSISSVSQDDDLSHSPSSDSSSSSDSDLLILNNTATHANEISSIRASSSTETLESTVTPNVRPSNLPPPSRPTLAAAPRSASTRIGAETTPASRPVIPLTRTGSLAQRNIAVSRAVVPPIQLGSAPLDNGSDSDSDTIISESHANDMVVDMLGAPWTPPSFSYPVRGPTPFRRDSNDRIPSNATYGAASMARTSSASRDPRDSTARTTAPPPAQYQYRSASPRAEDAHPRAPPGLSQASQPHVATPPDGSPRGARDPAPSTSANQFSGLRLPPSSAPPLARTMSSRPHPQPSAGSPPGPQQRNGNGEMGSPAYPPPLTSGSSPLSPSPPRRETHTPSPRESPQAASPPHAGPLGAPQMPSPQEGGLSVAGGGMLVVAANKRSVRWTENLVCPSPVPVDKRRKGWFNCRGDQLWTNDGQYKVPETGQEYPLDLASYPEPNTGWMNEEGIRIDMQHRLIPKQPLRPALKRSKPLSA